MLDESAKLKSCFKQFNFTKKIYDMCFAYTVDTVSVPYTLITEKLSLSYSVQISEYCMALRIIIESIVVNVFCGE